MKIVPHHRWKVIRYIGCALPVLSAFQHEIIRKQLDERYCPHCGEYIYNPFRRRKIRHYHHLKKKHQFVPLVEQRLVIHPQHFLVEWRRRFPDVMKLILTEKEMFFYNHIKPQFIHRIPALRMWTIDEWNTLNPTLYIWKTDGLTKIKLTPDHEILYTPDLVF